MSFSLLRRKKQNFGKTTSGTGKLKWLVSTRYLELGRIARRPEVSQSKKMMQGIKEFYLAECAAARSSIACWRRVAERKEAIQWNCESITMAGGWTL